MAGRSNETVLRHLDTLFDAGAVAGLTDAQLLGRFADRRDDAGRVAFEALLRRHGPMVLGVCRRLLDDPHEAEDAFQATFLVLAIKARSVRRRESVGPWLHGVAFRVARRALTLTRRRRAGAPLRGDLASPEG